MLFNGFLMKRNVLTTDGLVVMLTSALPFTHIEG